MSLVTVYVVVHGPIYERYADALLPQLHDLFMPSVEPQIVVLPGNGGWPHGSASRYQVALDHADELEGDWIFQIDADMAVLQPVDPCILANGLIVTTHPGYPPDTPEQDCPYERNPLSRGCVPVGMGRRYHPGAFVGGRRAEFLAMCETTMRWYDEDRSDGFVPIWYEESYLNRYLLDHEPALVLDRRFCWWQFWQERDGAILMHLDKTTEEVTERARG